VGSSRVVLAALTVAVLAGAGACARPGVNVEPATAVTESPSPSPSPSPVDPLAELVAAISKTRATTLTFTIDGGPADVGNMHGAGAVDPANHRQSMTMTITDNGKTTREQVVTIGTDLYMKSDDPPPGVSRKKWMHVNMAKFGGSAIDELGDLTDPSGLESYAKAATTVHRTGPGQYEGTLDFTKMSPELATGTISSNVGDAFKALPFTATADAQGRLTSMVIKFPSMGDGMPATTVTTRFSGFGAPVKIQAPPKSQVQEAPKDFLS
jgi:hypothetical protein